MGRKAKTDYATAFGQALDAQLARRSLSQTVLANLTGTSTSYINKLMHGHKVPPAELTGSIAAALNLAPPDRAALFRAAAQAAGYQIDEAPPPLDLTKPLRPPHT